MTRFRGWPILRSKKPSAETQSVLCTFPLIPNPHFVGPPKSIVSHLQRYPSRFKLSMCNYCIRSLRNPICFSENYPNSIRQDCSSSVSHFSGLECPQLPRWIIHFPCFSACDMLLGSALGLRHDFGDAEGSMDWLENPQDFRIFHGLFTMKNMGGSLMVHGGSTADFPMNQFVWQCGIHTQVGAPQLSWQTW